MIDFYEHIGDFLSSKLSDEDRILFERAMEEDPELRKAVDNHNIVEEALELLIEDDIRSVIKNLKTDSPVQKSTYLGFKTYLLVAGIMLLLALLAYIIKQNSKPDVEILYAQYFSDYVEPNTRGEILPTSELTVCDQGHKLMFHKNYPEAAVILESAAQIENDCTDKSQWYLSLLYLLEKKEDKLDSLLLLIQEDEISPYHNNAIKLFKEIN